MTAHEPSPPTSRDPVETFAEWIFAHDLGTTDAGQLRDSLRQVEGRVPSRPVFSDYRVWQRYQLFLALSAVFPDALMTSEGAVGRCLLDFAADSASLGLSVRTAVSVEAENLSEPLPWLLAPTGLVEWLEMQDPFRLAARLTEETARGSPAPEYTAGADWALFTTAVRRTFQAHGLVVVRGLPALPSGASALAVAHSLGSDFMVQPDGCIVRTFRMTPWNPATSHTTRPNLFHTDFNSSPDPPAATAVHCLRGDPGGPNFGVNRVADLSVLLGELDRRGDRPALDMLTRQLFTIRGGDDRIRWGGTLISGQTIRFRPEAVLENCPPELNQAAAVAVLDRIHAACLAVSPAFALAAGDTLLVDNRRALHYRGQCTVSFADFPDGLTAREIATLHLHSLAGGEGAV